MVDRRLSQVSKAEFSWIHDIVRVQSLFYISEIFRVVSCSAIYHICPFAIRSVKKGTPVNQYLAQSVEEVVDVNQIVGIIGVAVKIIAAIERPCPLHRENIDADIIG